LLLKKEAVPDDTESKPSTLLTEVLARESERTCSGFGTIDPKTGEKSTDGLGRRNAGELGLFLFFLICLHILCSISERKHTKRLSF
jgi:hypothetical protein